MTAFLTRGGYLPAVLALLALALALLAPAPLGARQLPLMAWPSGKPPPPPPDYTPPPLESHPASHPGSWYPAAVPADPLDRAAPPAAGGAAPPAHVPPAPAATRAPAPGLSGADALRGHRFGGVFEFCEWFVVFLLVAPGTFPALGCLFLSAAQFLRRRAGVATAADDVAYSKLAKEVKEVESDDDVKFICLDKAT